MKTKNGILIDSEDANILETHWLCVLKRGQVIAQDKATKKRIVLAKLLLKPDNGFEVDHINHNGLDNRRKNLRLATPSQNKANRRTVNKRSLPKGVYFEPTRNSKKPYLAVCIKNGKRYQNGRHETIESAVIAYNELAVKLFGQFAYPSV